MKAEDIIATVLLSLDLCKGNVAQFKQMVLRLEYSPMRGNFSRTLAWKVCLITDLLDIKTWESKLGDTRVVWHELSTRADLVVPWHRLPSDSTFYIDKFRTPVKRNPSTMKMGKTNLTRVLCDSDPLLLSRSPSPGPKIRFTDEDVDLLLTIIVDIDRLFPGVPFFNLEGSIKYKRMLIHLLYVWLKCNSNVGYKQGFHEVMGLILVNLYRELVEVPLDKVTGNDRKILSMYNRKYLAHDVFTCFNRFVVEGGIIGLYYELEPALWQAIDKFNVQLMKVDQVIHYHLISKLKLESQLWIIRFFRLLLLREVGELATALLVWDRMIAAKLLGASLPDLINFMVISLVIQVKTQLVVGDFSELLSLLLHYPIEQRTLPPHSRYEFVHNLISDGYTLYQVRDDDLALYETGNKLNAKHNPDLKITMSYGSSSPKNDQLQFEKTRLEMRLKKKAQAMTKPQ